MSGTSGRWLQATSSMNRCLRGMAGHFAGIFCIGILVCDITLTWRFAVFLGEGNDMLLKRWLWNTDLEIAMRSPT